MRKKTSLLPPAFMACGMLTLVLPNATARDREFAAVVHHIESHYHARHNYGFLFWFAGIAIKVAHPCGVKSLNMAIFEDQNFSASRNDEEFERVLRNALRPQWQPLVRMWSRREAERTYIYADSSGNDVKVLIVSLEQNEAVVVQVKMDTDRFAQLMNDPDSMAGSLAQKPPRRKGSHDRPEGNSWQPTSSEAPERTALRED